MSRLGGAFWFVLVVASAMTNFLVKQTVQGLDEQLNAVRKKTVAEQKAIHELTADWTFLNQPEHLADLNNRYIHLSPVAPRQIVTSLDSIPLRPTPPPEAAPQIAQALEAPPARPPVAAPLPVNPAPLPIIPVSASAPPRPQIAPSPIVPIAAAAPPRPQMAPTPPRPAKPASLDGVFAQITGDR